MWNLADRLSAPGRRAFSLPLAAIPPGRASVRAVPPAAFELSEPPPVEGDVGGRRQTLDLALRILIPVPDGGFTDEDGLPDPRIRLHAMVPGPVRFLPAADGLGDRLVITTPAFVPARVLGAGVHWWERWMEAQCIPQMVIYENVDRAHLEQLVRGLPPATGAGPPAPRFGLSLPAGVTAARLDAFVADFFSGRDGFILAAQAGAVLGRAALAVAAAEAAKGTRELVLHARYQGHTEAAPHPMNPRELLYLLFGDDSAEAREHPLLLRMEEKGKTQTGVHPESRRMLLRPPLRTSARVRWEARQEIDHHQRRWRPSGPNQTDGRLGPERFYNRHERQGRRFNAGEYHPFNKCNLFVSDICLRAGFRVGVHPVGTQRWHYVDANSYTNLAHAPGVSAETAKQPRVPLTGAGPVGRAVWGWQVENWLADAPPETRMRRIDDAITGEGRCLILAGGRKRLFRGTDIEDCAAALRRDPIGHIVIVESAAGTVELADATAPARGLAKLDVETLQASGEGAVDPLWKARLGGAAGSASDPRGFLRLHLIELHPGRDPDTLQGLADLNVQTVNRNLLGVPDERADPARRKVVEGQPRMCCQDNYPPRNAAPTVVPCPA